MKRVLVFIGIVGWCNGAVTAQERIRAQSPLLAEQKNAAGLRRSSFSKKYNVVSLPALTVVCRDIGSGTTGQMTVHDVVKKSSAGIDQPISPSLISKEIDALKIYKEHAQLLFEQGGQTVGMLDVWRTVRRCPTIEKGVRMSTVFVLYDCNGREITSDVLHVTDPLKEGGYAVLVEFDAARPWDSLVEAVLLPKQVS